MFRLCALVLVIYSYGTAVSQAQQQPILGAPSVDEVVQGAGSSQSLKQSESNAKDQTILVIGDGLAGGLGAGMQRADEGGNDVGNDIITRSQEASGLARPEVYNWADALPNLIADAHFEAVVVMIGLNDRQDVRLGAVTYKFGSADWIRAYTAQTKEFADALKSSGMKVYWVSLPPMRDAAYASDMKVIASIQAAQAQAHGFTLLDPAPLLISDGGETGSASALRDERSVGLSRAGNDKIGQWVLQSVEGPEVPSNLAVTRVEKQDAPTGQSSPLFGQAVEGGAVAIFRPKPIDALQGSLQAAPEDGRQPINRSELLNDSGAEKLFTLGISATPPSGRFDDFTAPRP